MDTTKHDRFVRVAEKRMEVLINDFYKLGNCASRFSYDYTDEEVEKILGEIEHQTNFLRDRFSEKNHLLLTQ